MQHYHFLPFTVTLHEDRQTISILSHTLYVIHILQGHVLVNTSESHPLNELDLYSFTASSCPDIVIIQPSKDSLFALFQISLDYICCRNHFVTPLVLIDSASDLNHSYLMVNRLFLKLLTMYFDESTPLTQLEKALEDVVYAILNRHTEISDAAKSPSTIRKNKLRYLLYLEYNTSWTLPDLAAELGLTPQYISLYVKQNLGISFQQYLLNRRLAAAEKYLIYTSMPVSDISGAAGFTNTIALNQAFREHLNMTPTQYRRLHRQSFRLRLEFCDNPQYVSSLSLMENLDSYYRHPCDRTSGYKIMHRLTESGSVSLPSGDMLHIGAAEKMLNHQVCTQIQYVLPWLHIKYVRLNTLFSEPNTLFDRKTQTFTFLQTEPILRIIADMNLYPMILFRIDPDIPTDILIREFLKFAVETFGCRHVRHWRFECLLADFNQPLWELSPKKKDEISRQLDEIHTHIKCMAPGAALGCYLFSHEQLHPDHAGLLQMLYGRGITPDFITVDLLDTYITRTDSYYSLSIEEYWKSANPYFLFQKLTAFCRTLGEFYTTNPVPIYGNIAMHLHLHHILNDTLYAAVFMLFNLLKCRMHLTHFIFPYLSELCHPLYRQDSSLHHGIYSLLTDRGIPKPLFFAMAFFRSLPLQVSKVGENYILNREPDGSATLLLFNYKHPTRFFCNHPSRLAPEDIAAIFHEYPPDEIQIRLEASPGSLYVTEQYLLNREHGSLLGLCENTSSLQPPVYLAHHIREMLRPAYRLNTVQIDGDELKLDLKLPMHAVMLLHIYPAKISDVRNENTPS